MFYIGLTIYCMTCRCRGRVLLAVGKDIDMMNYKGLGFAGRGQKPR